MHEYTGRPFSCKLAQACLRSLECQCLYSFEVVGIRLTPIIAIKFDGLAHVQQYSSCERVAHHIKLCPSSFVTDSIKCIVSFSLLRPAFSVKNDKKQAAKDAHKPAMHGSRHVHRI